MDALGFFFSQPVLKKPLRNLLFKLSLFAFHCPGFTLEQGTPEAQGLISITGTSKLLRVFTNLLQKCWEGPHQDKLTWKLNNDNYLMAGPIFWTLLFIFCPFSKTGKKSWAEQHKNKQQNSSLQPQPTSPVIWEKYSLPHICPCRLPSLIYCREKNYSGTVGSTEDLWSQWEWQTWHRSPAELLAVESAGSWSQSISRCSSICSRNICSVSICKSHQGFVLSCFCVVL